MLAWECVGHELNTKPRVGHCSVVDILVILQYQTFLKEHAVLYFLDLAQLASLTSCRQISSQWLYMSLT